MFNREESSIHLSQSAKLHQLIVEFEMENWRPATSPMTQSYVKPQVPDGNGKAEEKGIYLTVQRGSEAYERREQHQTTEPIRTETVPVHLWSSLFHKYMHKTRHMLCSISLVQKNAGG